MCEVVGNAQRRKKVEQGVRVEEVAHQHPNVREEHNGDADVVEDQVLVHLYTYAHSFCVPVLIFFQVLSGQLECLLRVRTPLFNDMEVHGRSLTSGYGAREPSHPP